VRAPSTQNRQEVSYVKADGKFYLAGGSTLHERYDPATNSWSTVKPLPANLDHIQGVELGGLIYYVGGLQNWPGPQSNTVYVYDPKTDTFSEGTPMPSDRGRGAGGVAVYNGKIYYAGGLHDGKAVPWFDVYDPVAKSWTKLADMPRARDHFQGAVVDGRFYAIGGRDTAIDATTTKVDVYNLAGGASSSWQTPATDLPTARGGFATAVVGKEVLVIGGEGGGKTYDKVEAYDTANNSWRTLAPMPTARHGIQAVECNGGVYVAAGGKTQGGGNPTNVHEAFFLNGPTKCGSSESEPGKPQISDPRPKPGSKTRDRTPTIGATVTDVGSELGQEDIKLFVDGQQKQFTYSAETDRLTYQSGTLSPRGHTVTVEATDEAGNKATKSWSFKVVDKKKKKKRR
jgi:Kelch motif